MGERIPGPVCSTRVGDDWIDLGTTCRSQTGKPGPIGIANALGGVALNALLPFKIKFDREHVYSKAREAARKRDIDLQIIGDDYRRSGEIRIDNEKYLKELIRLGSNGSKKVSDSARKTQFFIIRGGAEGLLPAKFEGVDTRTLDATNVIQPGTTTGGATSLEYHWDNNDLLAVFDPRGKLIGAALLRRPISISDESWTAPTANTIYNAWNNKEVSIYRNRNYEVPYLGLVVDDGMKKKGWVDMHKQEDSNGCILIVDPDTPALGTAALNEFEPKLLTDVLASIGKKPDQVNEPIPLGIMHLVDIK